MKWNKNSAMNKNEYAYARISLFEKSGNNMAKKSVGVHCPLINVNEWKKKLQKQQPDHMSLSKVINGDRICEKSS